MDQLQILNRVGGGNKCHICLEVGNAGHLEVDEHCPPLTSSVQPWEAAPSKWLR